MKRFELKYRTVKTTDQYKLIINIRLSDDCHNGHADFAITGDFYDYVNGGQVCGCIHEIIEAICPEFRPFIALHLCDAKGAPMYAQGNGFYHLHNSSREVTMNELRITQQEYDRFLREAEDQLYFTYLLQTMGIPERWEEEARAAIKQLEELTGQMFEDTSVRYQFTPLTPEEMQLVERRLSEGYYLPENIRKRKRKAALAAKRQKIADLKAAALRQKQKIDQKLQVELYLFKLGAPLESFIYYDHSNEVAFNWTHRIYERERMSEEQYNALMRKIDPTKLPTGITFKFKPAA
ncbi:hypothetical protein [Alistipes senegalensis]|uniref:hypothetical protein n=1 Tax=Alistipes senegalensis TaxID=1288121 RepID=UPI00101DD8C4|nr:hypothetical protein [Alistipes senegalensis]MBQ4280377.1 hypothetical protein [Rikenellaceae bacterium]